MQIAFGRHHPMPYGEVPRTGMPHRPIMLAAPMIVILAAATGFCGHLLAQPTHKCDPVDPLADVGWSVVPSLETVGAVDGAPFQVGRTGDWFVERVTTRIPFCNYYNDMRSESTACDPTLWRPRSPKNGFEFANIPPPGAVIQCCLMLARARRRDEAGGPFGDLTARV
jgi:hypothetical protein